METKPLESHLARLTSGFKHNATQAGYTWNIEFWYRTDLQDPES